MKKKAKAWLKSRMEYSEKYLRVNRGRAGKIAALPALMNLRTIPRGSSKTRQLCRLFAEAKLNDKGHGNFFYSLDEQCVPLLNGAVIYNMPIDYSIVVDHSLNELREKNQAADNHISRQNLKMISVIEEYIKDLVLKIGKSTAAGYLSGISTRRAETLEEALQRILLFNQLLWQSKHALMGFGRIDRVLERFEITGDSKDIIKNFMETLHEFYNFKSNSLLGDTGQIFLLGGLNEDGSYYCNGYTYLFIECIKELRLPDPKILLRSANNMPEDLLFAAAQCIATGVGSPLLSNDEVVIPALMDFGYSREDAYNYATSACWEPLVAGKSLEQNNIASIVYGRALHNTCVDKAFANFKNFEGVLNTFYRYVAEEVQNATAKVDRIEWEYDPLLTLFTEGCVEKDRDISRGGTIYNDYGMLTEGMSSAVNSLLNIRRFCFEEKSITLQRVKECIEADYKGFDRERELLCANENGFGTESEEAIALTNDIIAHTAACLKDYRNRFGGRVKFGLSSPNYVTKGMSVGATADGRRAKTPFATHISREKGEPITEIANFASSLDYKGSNANANVVDVIVQPGLISDNPDKFVRYLKGIIKEGVFQIQFNVLSYEKLLDAKAHPEKYPQLIVRVWGFSAYFNDLPESYQDQLIKRAKEMERA